MKFHVKHYTPRNKPINNRIQLINIPNKLIINYSYFKKKIIIKIK